MKTKPYRLDEQPYVGTVRHKHGNRGPSAARQRAKDGVNKRVDIARGRIIAVIRKRKCFLRAQNFKDALATLRQWVTTNDGKLGHGKESTRALNAAFASLVRAGVLVFVDNKRDSGFLLTAV